MSSNIKKQNGVKIKTSKTGTKPPKDDDKEEKKTKTTPKPPINGVRVKATPVTAPSGSKTSSMVKKRVPISPTSTRVSKSEYYPTKSIYSNALNANSTKASPKIKESLTTSSTRTSQNTSKTMTNVKKPKELSPNAQKTKTKAVATALPSQKPKTLAEIKKEMREQLIKKSTTSKNAKSSTKAAKSPDSSSSQLERPRTATLKRPSIVSTNIAGPEVTRLKKINRNADSSITESIGTIGSEDQETIITEDLSTTSKNYEKNEEIEDIEENGEETDDNYEDDFDSYASDFEEYHSEASKASNTSSEPIDVSTEGEETSSSSEEAPPSQKTQVTSVTPPRRINSAEEERKLDSGNFDLPQESSHSNSHNQEPKKLQILDRIKEHEPVLSSLSDEGFEEQKTSLQFVNFAEAKKQRQKQRKQKVTKRGGELMSMIRLDQQNFTIFDLPAQSYDVFIKSFGNRNSTQVASQTGDDRIDEEVQTDLIQYQNKWTQFPIDKITKSKNPLQFKEDLLGVGSDTLDVHLLNPLQTPNVLEYNEYNLEKFLLAKEHLIVELLKETQYGNKAEMSAGKFPFSQGYLVLDTEGLGIAKSVTFSSSNKNPKIITIHEYQDQEMIEKSHGFVWSLQKPSVPEDDFFGFGEITDVTFGLDNDKLVFAGFKDGCLAVWDLLEDTPSKNRPPSFLTEVDFDSTEEVVRVLCFKPVKSNDFQVITLNETGKLVIWALIITPTESLGLNRISLIRNNTILLNVQHQMGQGDQNLRCTDLCLSQNDPNHLYVSTNFGVVLHSLVSGTRTNPRSYNTGQSTTVNILESCPHNPKYFLSGLETGEVVLHTKQFEKPLMTISNQESDAPILMIHWSRNRPCIFYTLDARDNINVWDLSVSELYPQITIHLKEKIRGLKVSPLKSETSYMAVVTGDGKIHLHLLNQEHGMQEVEVYAGDLRKLNNYVQKL